MTTTLAIALHCSASSGRQWDALGRLLPLGIELVAPDLMGYDTGEPWNPTVRTSLDSEALRLEPLLEEARHPVHLIGHSYGGAVALQLALRRPDKIGTLTLFEPVRFALLLHDPAYRPVGEAIVRFGRGIADDASAGRMEQAAAAFIDYWSGQGAWSALSPGRRHAVAERMPKVGAEFNALFEDDVPAGAYATLSMPVRLISGSTSPLPARRVTDILARYCAHAQVVRLDGVGHMGPVTHPALVAQHLAFLAPLRLAA